MKKMNCLSLTILSCLISSSAFADNLCDDTQSADAAKRVLDRVQHALKIKRPDLYNKVSSAGVLPCDPTSLILAAGDPDESAPQIRFSETCGAILTFKDADNQHEVARWIAKESHLSGITAKVCVGIDKFHPGLSVTSGN